MMDELQFNTAAQRAIDEEVQIELWLCSEAVHSLWRKETSSSGSAGSCSRSWRGLLEWKRPSPTLKRRDAVWLGPVHDGLPPRVNN
jgi:hypothetical protein